MSSADVIHIHCPIADEWLNGDPRSRAQWPVVHVLKPPIVNHGRAQRNTVRARSLRNRRSGASVGSKPIDTAEFVPTLGD